METNDDNKPHKQFATWLQPVALKLDRESLTARWTSVSRIVDSLAYDEAIPLVRYVFDEKFSTDSLEWFQERFQEDDAMFSMDETENRNELKSLAGIVLILRLEELDELAADIGTCILGVYCGGMRKLDVNLPIVKYSGNAVRQHSIVIREKPKPELKFHSNGTWDRTAILTAVKKINVDEGTNIQTAILTVVNATQNSLEAQSETIEKIINVQDEELNILWWLINSYSTTYECKFEQIEATELAVVIGFELAQLTTTTTEFPSLEAVLLRAGVQRKKRGGKIAFVDLVNAISEPAKLFKDGFSGDEVQTPLLFSINKRLELGAEVWWEKCQTILGFDEKFQLTATEWAMQACREVLSIESKRAYNV